MTLPSRRAGRMMLPTLWRNLSTSSGVATMTSTATPRPKKFRWMSCARRPRCETSRLMTRRSRSLSGPACPRAAEPKRIMRSGRATSTTRRTTSSSSAWSGQGACRDPASGGLTTGSRSTQVSLALLRVPAGEDRRHVVEHVGGAHVAVAVVLDQAPLDDVDLLLGLAVHHGGDEARELDRVLLVLEELQLEGLLQPLVGLVVELLALEGQGRDVVHDLAAEVVLAALGDVDLLLDRAHEPLVGVLLLAGELVADLLPEGVGLDVVHVVPAQAGDRLLVGGDPLLDLVLHDVLVLLLDLRQELALALAHFLAGDEAV